MILFLKEKNYPHWRRKHGKRRWFFTCQKKKSHIEGSTLKVKRKYYKM
jgi:hypothetical protein